MEKWKEKLIFGDKVEIETFSFWYFLKYLQVRESVRQRLKSLCHFSDVNHLLASSLGLGAT